MAVLRGDAAAMEELDLGVREESVAFTGVPVARSRALGLLREWWS